AACRPISPSTACRRDPAAASGRGPGRIDKARRATLSNVGACLAPAREGRAAAPDMPTKGRLNGPICARMHGRRNMRRLLLAAVAAGFALAGAAHAADYKIMAPAAPGGGWDQTARTMQSVLQEEKISSSVQVQNVPGAG